MGTVTKSLLELFEELSSVENEKIVSEGCTEQVLHLKVEEMSLDNEEQLIRVVL
jgi:hypothetical protein